MIQLKEKVIKIDNQERDIELQMDKSLKKLPFEMKKIKFVLWLLKKINNVKKSRFNILKFILVVYIIISLYLLFIK